MTRPLSNLKFKQKSSLITVILFGHVIYTGTKYSRKNLENTIVLTTKIKKIASEIKIFISQILFQILCQSFRHLGDFQSFELKLQNPPTIHVRLTILSSTIVRFQGSIAIRLHLSLRGRSLSSLGLHFEHINTSGISFRDI